MLEPAKFDMTMIVGAVWASPLFSIETESLAKDLTGCLVEFKIYNEDGSLIKNLLDGSGLVLDRTNGSVVAHISAASTGSDFVNGWYHYQLWITEVDGLDKNLYIFGALEVML